MVLVLSITTALQWVNSERMTQHSFSYINCSLIDKNDYFSMDTSRKFYNTAGEKMLGPRYPINTSMLKFLDLFLLFHFVSLKLSVFTFLAF